MIPIRNFDEGYGSVKALCDLYADDEAKGVSSLYGRFSFAASPGPVVVLDIEASFDAATREGADNSQDRIDLVLLELDSRTLLFTEAKRFTNPELRASADAMPPVAAQVARYRDQVSAQREDILSAYGRYIAAMNALLGLQVPSPLSVLPEVPLLIFGYDGAQESRVKECVGTLRRFNVRAEGIGKLPPAKVSTLMAWFARARRS